MERSARERRSTLSFLFGQGALQSRSDYPHGRSQLAHRPLAVGQIWAALCAAVSQAGLREGSPAMGFKISVALSGAACIRQITR